jgi:hypothetical protein
MVESIHDKLHGHIDDRVFHFVNIKIWVDICDKDNFKPFLEKDG